MERVNQMVLKLLRLPYVEKLLLRDTGTIKMVEALHRRENKREIFFDIWRQRIIMLAAGGGVAVLFLVAGLCQELPRDVIVNGNYLQKNPGQEQAVFDVEAETEAGTAVEEIVVDLSREEQTGERAGEKTAEATPDPREVLLSEIREAIQTAVSAQEELEDGERIALPETVSGKEITYRNHPILIYLPTTFPARRPVPHTYNFIPSLILPVTAPACSPDAPFSFPPAAAPYNPRT